MLYNYITILLWCYNITLNYTEVYKLLWFHIKLYNLKFKDLTQSKSCFQNPEKDLFCKIVSGDKSDGIPSVFKKCGIKTAETNQQLKMANNSLKVMNMMYSITGYINI